ncbi:hypothetical protein [Saliphagus sp. LR7]|uniref:hypothetical protein n=1 Tax=Saliphagus sp. LR7 TaxID=2282654 RepID=UPI000DF8016A|nr:hypothetical protein [Saliphagus sp. LR7]
MWRSWLRGGAEIARGEWVLHRRERGGVARRGLAFAVFVVGAALGWGAYGIGREVAGGESVPFGVLGIAAAATMAWVAWRSSRLTRDSFEGLNPEFLLTTVPARIPALGLLVVVYARVATVLAVPTVAIGVGGAVGLRTPALALTVVLAVAAATAAAVGVGVSVRLVASLAASRLSRGRTYRDLVVLFGWVPLVVGWFLLIETVERVSIAWLAAAPTRGVADLALLGAAGRTGADPASGLAALAVFASGAALSVGTTTFLARRIWEGEPAGRAPKTGSHPLLEPGWVERLTGERIPRPVRTVARKRWLVERRTARGLLYAGQVVGFSGIVLFPAGILAGGVPLFVLVVHSLGLAVGIAFGSDPIGIEYRGLQMMLTTVGGRAFVGGFLLAALAPAAVIVPAVVLPLGAVSTATAGETLSFVLFGIAVCGSTATLALAVGLGVERSAFVPHPGFFTDAPWYIEIGWEQFGRLGVVLVAATLSALPAFVGTHPVVYEYLAGAGLSVPTTRSVSLLLGALVAVGVTRLASVIAIDRYEGYSFE